MIDQSETLPLWAPDIVIYHDPCLDGFTAAWVAWLRWPAAKFIGSNYGQPAPDVSGKNVLIVDFSYKASALEELRKSASSIVILDHHKTARDDLAPFAFRPNEPELFTLREVTEAIHFLRHNGITPICALLDMDRSGAGMAWDFCFPNQPMPWLVRLVQDRDLWRFAHRPFTGDFGLRLSTEVKSFERWSEISGELPNDPITPDCAYIDGGTSMREYRDWLVGEIASKAEIRPIDNHWVPVVDCPYALASEVGHRLCQLHPDRSFSALRVHSTSGTSYSLRSANGFDVSVVAAKFGGGGHAGAAGFRVPPAV